MITSRSIYCIHVAANCIISSFLWLSNITLCAYICGSLSLKYIYLFIFICLVVLDSVTPWTIVSYGSSVHGILQAILLERVAIPFSRGSFWPRDKTLVSCIEGRFFTVWATREAPCIYMYECEHECVCIFKITSLFICQWTFVLLWIQAHMYLFEL